MTYKGSAPEKTTMARTTDQNKTVVTTMRFSPGIIAAATDKARSIGLNRTQYVEQLIRRDLGMETVSDVTTRNIFG